MFKKAIFICLLILLTISSKACDRSSLTLTDVDFDGTLYTLEMALAVGGGVLGVNAGGDGATGVFFIGINPVAGETISLIDYSPSSITGSVTGCGGALIEPGPNPFAPIGILANIQGCQLTCVSSTALCGEPFTEEFTISLTLTGLPESIQCFGIEGNGNPYAGCTGEADMTVYPNSFLPLDWGTSGLTQNSNSTTLYWSTLSETETYRFEIEKTYDGRVFYSQGSLPAAHFSDQERHYEFELERETEEVYYRIVLINSNGSREVSKLHFASPLSIDQPKYFPNPSTGELSLFLAGHFQLLIFDMFGREIKSTFGTDQIKLDLTFLPSGTYQLMVLNGKKHYTQSWIKLN